MKVLCRLAYPMPPAGADPETWVPEEEPQPIGISVHLPHGSILPGANHQLPGLACCLIHHDYNITAPLLFFYS